MEIVNIKKNKKTYVITFEDLEEVVIKKEWVQLLKDVPELSFAEKIEMLSVIELERQNNRDKRLVSEFKVYTEELADGIELLLESEGFERVMLKVEGHTFKEMLDIICNPEKYMNLENQDYDAM